MDRRRRPPGPPRPPRPPGGGMGNPMEENFYYTGYRDFGSADPQPQDIIYDPTMDPTKSPPDVQRKNDEFWARCKEELPKIPVFTKEPAFISPPFFSRPKIKFRRMTIPAAGLVGAPNTTVLDWALEDRQHWIMTSIGLETDNPAITQNGLVIFRFTVNNVIYQLWDDQTVDIIDPPGPPAAGETSRIPGTIAAPFNLRDAGLVFGVDGPARILLECRNSNPVLPANDITITAQISFYEYWMPNNSQFEGGQWQY
jgi:hypothetical protein